MEKVYFKEEQKLTQTWIWLLVVASFAVIFFLIGRDLFQNLGNKEDVLLYFFLLLLMLLICFIVVWLLLKTKLVLEIRKDGVWFKFLPLINKWKHIPSEEIEKCEVRKFRPIREFGGWGIKGGRKVSAYTIFGDIGLQMELKNRKKILIGIKQKLSIESAMQKMMAHEQNK